MESRRVGSEIYRRRTCGHCLKVFVSVETAPAGLKMPSVANNRTKAPEQPMLASGFTGWRRA